MKKIGSTLAFFGVLAIVLDFANRVPRVLMWIYSWGNTVAWGIKIALIIIGGTLYFIGRNSENSSD